MNDRLMSESWEASSVEPGHAWDEIDDEASGEAAPPLFDERILAELIDLAIDCAPRKLLRRVQEIARTERLTLGELLFDRIGPIANRLGDCWLRDSLGFGAVTVGVNALQRVIAELGYEAEGPLLHRELVVLTAAPGEQHVLPIHLLSEAVRAEGWATHVEPRMEVEDLMDLVSVEEVAMVGVTCKDPARLSGLETLVESVRAASIAPVRFALGGSPDLESHAQGLGFTYFPTGREICRWLAPRRTI